MSISLAQLDIVPAPDRPYLGGSLRDAVEWDGFLVEMLIKRYAIRTALDVG